MTTVVRLPPTRIWVLDDGFPFRVRTKKEKRKKKKKKTKKTVEEEIPRHLYERGVGRFCMKEA